MQSTRSDSYIAALLVFYLLLTGIAALVLLVIFFPKVDTNNVLTFVACEAKGTWTEGCSNEQALIWLSFFSGVMGSFLHGAQSLTSYVGNGTFKRSWFAWYMMRPWIGGILAVAIFFVVRAGFIGSGQTDSVNPYGLVAFGLLGGWFSKVASDKLRELFETLFKTKADDERKHKLTEGRVAVTAFDPPSPVPAGTTLLSVKGTGFADKAVVVFDGTPVATTFVSATELTVDLTTLQPAPSGQISVIVRNPSGAMPESAPLKLDFA